MGIWFNKKNYQKLPTTAKRLTFNPDECKVITSTNTQEAVSQLDTRLDDCVGSGDTVGTTDTSIRDADTLGGLYSASDITSINATLTKKGDSNLIWHYGTSDIKTYHAFTDSISNYKSLYIVTVIGGTYLMGGITIPTAILSATATNFALGLLGAVDTYFYGAVFVTTSGATLNEITSTSTNWPITEVRIYGIK